MDTYRRRGGEHQSHGHVDRREGRGAPIQTHLAVRVSKHPGEDFTQSFQLYSTRGKKIQKNEFL